MTTFPLCRTDKTVVPRIFNIRSPLNHSLFKYLPQNYPENKFQIPPSPPLLKGGEGGFSLFEGDEPVMKDYPANKSLEARREDPEGRLFRIFGRSSSKSFNRNP